MSDPNDPYSQPAYGQPAASGQQPMNASKGFLGALFDFSFTHFVTPMIVKFVYVLAVVALGLTWLFFLIAAFAESAGIGVVVLILGPIGMLIYLAFIRMTLEFYLAVTRMSEDIHKRLPA
jgi:hypothetical protein